MNLAKEYPVLYQTLRYLAPKYAIAKQLDDSLTQDEELVHLITDLEQYRTHTDLDRAERWQIANNYVTAVFDQQQRSLRKLSRQHRQETRPMAFSLAEATLLSELTMLYGDQLHLWNCTWSYLEQVSTLQLDDSVTMQALVDAPLPHSFWIEWKGSTGSYKPWIQRTRGLLVSRLAILDAPAAHQQDVISAQQQTPTDRHSLFHELLKFSQDDIHCSGYVVIPIQLDAKGKIQCSVAMFGHCYKTPVAEALACAADSAVRDRRKTRDTENVWSQIAVRLMCLIATTSPWKDNATVASTENQVRGLGPQSGKFSAARCTNDARTITLKPLKRLGTPFAF